MIVVTGGSGFIGKALIKKLITLTDKKILNVDYIPNDLVETIDPYKFIKHLDVLPYIEKIDIIFHNGACSDTTNNNVFWMI